MKVLVSGTSGFIGHHLVKRLEKLDYEVVPMPRYLSLLPSSLGEFVESRKPDFAIHLASYGNHYFQTEEDIVYRANVEYLFNLLDNLKDKKWLKGFFNFSTTHHNLESGTAYGSTKAMGEYLVRSYVAKFGFPAVNIRPYSVYGEYEWDFRFIPTITREIDSRRDITVTPGVAHDWIYVEDLIDGLLEVIEKREKLWGKSVGLGTGKRIPNLEIAKLAMKVIGKKVNILKGKKRQYEIAAYTKTLLERTANERNEIEYFQFVKTPLKEGIRRVWQNPQKHLRR